MLENEIDVLPKSIEESKIIRSFPDIGEKIAATIISEIGENERFNPPKKLVAFAGLDPSVFESGTFKGTYNRIPKEALADYGKLCIWLLNVPFVNVANRKQQMKSFLVIRDYERSMIRNGKKENLLEQL
jgi:hypothetical protein